MGKEERSGVAAIETDGRGDEFQSRGVLHYHALVGNVLGVSHFIDMISGLRIRAPPSPEGLSEFAFDKIHANEEPTMSCTRHQECTLDGYEAMAATLFFEACEEFFAALREARPSSPNEVDAVTTARHFAARLRSEVEKARPKERLDAIETMLYGIFLAWVFPTFMILHPRREELGDRALAHTRRNPNAPLMAHEASN